MVAPKPPRSGGASANAATSGWCASSDWTIPRWTPIPRPWINRTSVKPRAWAASRYSETVDDLLGAADPRAGKHRALDDRRRRVALGVLARLGHELLEPERHVVGHPRLDPLRRVEVRRHALERVAERSEPRLEPAQARFE